MVAACQQDAEDALADALRRAESAEASLASLKGDLEGRLRGRDEELDNIK